MPSLIRLVSFAVGSLAVVQGQGVGVIMKAQGTKGSPASRGLQVSMTDKADANIINKTEIADNMTNECGRTLLAGNIDIGEVTEDLLANKTITSTMKGGKVAVTINQGGMEGVGPYTCDLDVTSNAGSVTGQIPLTVTDAGTGKNGMEEVSVIMPKDMACIGGKSPLNLAYLVPPTNTTLSGSTGNICTVRCTNAQNYGGCFAVRQTDIKPAKLQAATIKTQTPLKGMFAQVMIDNIDLPATAKANQGSTEAEQGKLAIDAIMKNHAAAAASPQDAGPQNGTSLDLGTIPADAGMMAANAKSAAPIDGGLSVFAIVSIVASVVLLA